MTRALRRLLIAFSLLLSGAVAFAQPTFTISNVKNSCAGQNNGSFDVKINTANGSVTLLIFGPPNFSRVTSAGLTETFTGLKPQNYIIIAQDVDGNTIQFQSIVDVSPNISLSSAPTVVNNTDCITPNGSINISPTGGSGIYQYSWTGPGAFSANTQNLSGLVAGNYVVTITDAGANCSFTSAAIIVTDPLPSSFTISSPSASLCLGDILTINLSAAQNLVKYTVFVDGAATGTFVTGPTTTINYSGLPAGPHAISVQASYGICTVVNSTNTLNIPVNTPPTSATLSLSGINPICAGGSSSVKVTIVGGTSPYSFTITGLGPQVGYVSGTPIAVSPAATTTYTLSGLVTDANGCTVTGTGTTTINVNPLPTAVISTSPAAICKGQGSATLTFTLTGTAPFNVNYSDGTTTFNLVGISTGHTVSVSPLATKTYTITSVTDATTCPGASGSNTTVTVNNPPTSATLSLVGANTICAGASSSIKVTIVGGAGPFNFTITGLGPQVGYVSGTPITVTPAVTTSYSILGNTVTDSKGCTVSGAGTKTITVNPLPTAIIAASPSGFCAGQGNSTLTFTMTGTGPYNVTYTDGVTPVTLNGISSGHTVVVSPAATTTYTITSIKDATTCVGVAGSNTTVTVSTPPSSGTLSLNGTNPICAGQSTTLKVTITGGTGPYNFTITGLGPQVGYVSGTPITVSPAASTTYALTGNTVTDANGCTVVGTGSVPITVNPLPTAVIAASPATLCAGQGNATLTFTMTGTGPYNITYSDGVTPFTLSGVASGATVSVSPAATTTYTITSITDATTCAGVAGSNATVTVNTPATSATLSLNGANPICAGQSTTLKVTILGGTGPFSFTIPGIAPIAGYVSGTAITVTPASNTTYDLSGVTVTDAKGCTVVGTGSVAVTVNPLPTGTISASPAAICAGTNSTLTFTLTGTAPFNVNYSDGITTFNLVGITNGHTVSVSPVATTTYTITSITDATSCPGASGSNAVVTVNTPATSATLSLNGANPICAGQSTTLKVTIIGGTGPFSFTIPGIAPIAGYVSGTAITVSPAANTTYDMTGVTVTDAKGCTVSGTGSVPVTVSPAPTAVSSGGGTVCAGAPLPNVTFTFTGSAPFNFSYTDGATTFNVAAHPSTTFTIVNAPVGNYQVTALTDNGSCVGVSLGGAVAVVVTPVSTAVVSGGGTVCAGAALPNVTFTFTGTAPFNFTYSDGVTSTPVAAYGSTVFTINNAPAGTYSVSALTDITGCPAISLGTPVNVIVNPLPTAATSGGGTVCSGTPLPNVTFTFTGTAPFNFSYTDGVTTTPVAAYGSTIFTITNAPAGNYSVTTLTDASGCAATTLGSSVPVVVNALPTAAVSGGGPVCSGSPLPNVTFTFTGTAPFNFNYTDGVTSTPVVGYASNVFTINNAPAGTYSVTGLTDNSTCAATSLGSPVTVTVNPLPTSTVSGGGTVCSSSPLPSVTFTFTGTAPFDFSYTDGVTTTPVAAYASTTFTIASAAAGNYSMVSLKDATGCSATSLGSPVAVVVIPVATATLSGTANICVGTSTNLTVALTGTAPWNIVYSDGSTSFVVNGVASSPLTIAVSPSFTTTYSMVSVTDGVCGAGTVSGSPVVTVNPIPGNPATAGVDTWLGYVYDDSADPNPYPAKVDFSNSKYRGFIDETDIGSMSAFSSYNTASDVFDLNITNNVSGLTIHGPNVCGSYNDKFSVRFRMKKTFAQGVYTFTVGSDDGVRLFLDGVSIIPGAFINQSFTSYTSASQCISAGQHDLVIEYYENGGFSRLSFNYQLASPPTVTTPVTSCVNTATPVLTASSADPAVTGFNWYKDAALTTLLFNGASFTPAAADLDMTVVATTSFFATAVYACGETLASQVDVNIVGSATITPPVAPAQICATAGIVDLTTLVSAVPAGGSFVFSGTGVTVSPNFDPTLVAGTTSITANYTSGTCTSSISFNIDVINSATITVPAAPVTICQTSTPVDMTTLVSATPLGGAFTFTGPGVAGNIFDPSAQSGAVAITVNYVAGGCSDTKTLNFNVTTNAILTINNPTVCPGAGLVDLSSAAIITALPAGGVFTFSGPSVVGTMFDPSTHAGSVVNVNVTYALGGCTAVGSIAVTVRNVGDPACGSVTNCNVFNVTIIDTRPSCSGQNDGVIAITVSGGTPNYVVTLTDGGAFNQALPGPGPVFTFSNLSPANYTYTILDAIGNTCSLPHSLPVTATVQATASNFVDALCYNQPVGGATITVTSGGAPPYEYSADAGATWTSFTSPAAVNNLMPSLVPYAILVRDDATDLCPASVMVTIGNVPAADIAATVTPGPSTCAGNDGTAVIGTVSGGTGPYTYKMDGTVFATLPPANTFTALATGAHIFTVVDANACNKDFPFNITFPGQVNFTITPTNPDCAGNGTNGILTVTITSIGTFDVGISADPATPPASFINVVSSGNTPVIFNNLSKGTYYITAKSASAQCPTITPGVIGAGPSAVDFQLAPANIVCFENTGGATLTNIVGAPSLDYNYRIDSLGTIIQSGTITALQALSTVTLTGMFSGFNYQIQLSQDQSSTTGCAAPITSAFKQFLINGPTASLDTLSTKIVVSKPEIASGTLSVVIKETGLEPYQLKLDPVPPTPGNPMGWFDAVRNPQSLKMEYKFTGLAPGSYTLYINDGFGCQRDYPIDIEVDSAVFIPNIFTPNGDGVNDVFYIRNGAGSNVLIANRWGKEVYKSGNYQNDWGGGGIDDGIYYFTIVAGGKTFNGWLEIARGQ